MCGNEENRGGKVEKEEGKRKEKLVNRLVRSCRMMRTMVMNQRHNPTEKALAFIFIVGNVWARFSIS
jgi:hypothetical protein